MDDRCLSLIVHGDSKVGKSTLAASGPKPGLLLDAEGSTKFLPYKRRMWDPLAEAPPEPDGTWDVACVTVTDVPTLRKAYEYLQAGQHGFKSVSLDSITEIQRRVKKDIAPSSQMDMQRWGDLLDRLESIITGMRDLTLHKTNPVRTVTFVAESRLEGAKFRPYMQGQISVSFPYKVDILGYLTTVDVTGDDGKAFKQRVLKFAPSPFYEAGERVQGKLGDELWLPKPDDPGSHNVIERMLYAVYPELQAELSAAATPTKKVK